MKYIKHLPLALFILYCLKYLVLSVSYSDILLMGVLGLVASFFEFHENKDFRQFKAKFEKHEVDYKEKCQEINDLKGTLQGVKLGQTLRGQKLG